MKFLTRQNLRNSGGEPESDSGRPRPGTPSASTQSRRIGESDGRQGGGRKAMERTAECHCGQLRVIATGEPERVYLCACTSRQRATCTGAHNGARSWTEH